MKGCVPWAVTFFIWFLYHLNIFLNLGICLVLLLFIVAFLLTFLKLQLSLSYDSCLIFQGPNIFQLFTFIHIFVVIKQFIKVALASFINFIIFTNAYRGFWCTLYFLICSTLFSRSSKSRNIFFVIHLYLTNNRSCHMLYILSRPFFIFCYLISFLKSSLFLQIFKYFHENVWLRSSLPPSTFFICFYLFIYLFFVTSYSPRISLASFNMSIPHFLHFQFLAIYRLLSLCP